jgi:hypothetical protein
LGQEKFDDSLPLLIDGYQGMKKLKATIPDIAKPNLDSAIQRIISLYESTDREAEAETWRKRRSEQKPLVQ